MTYHMTSVVTPPPYCSGFRAEIEVGAVDDDIISRHGCKKFVEVKLEKKSLPPSFESQLERLCQVFWARCGVFVKLLSCSCPCRTMSNCALCTTVVLNEVITNPLTILHP